VVNQLLTDALETDDDDIELHLTGRYGFNEVKVNEIYTV
jgi:hypothetical protein